MFKREDHIKMMRTQMPNWTEEKIKEEADFMEEKYSHIKYGDNVVHLQYYNQLIPKEDIENIESLLSEFDHKLSRFEGSGIMTASFDAFQSQVVLVLSYLTVETVIQGITTNAIWDGIKRTSSYIWHRVNNKPHAIMESGGTVIEKRASFSLKMQLDENTCLEFNMKDIEEGEAERCLDKALEFAKQVQRNAKPKTPDIILYNKETMSWEKVVFTPELLRQPSDRIIRMLPLEDYMKEKGIK